PGVAGSSPAAPVAEGAANRAVALPDMTRPTPRGTGIWYRLAAGLAGPSDPLLMALLRAKRPLAYGRTRIEHMGAGGGPLRLDLSKLDDDELDQLHAMVKKAQPPQCRPTRHSRRRCMRSPPRCRRSSPAAASRPAARRAAAGPTTSSISTTTATSLS